LGAATWTGPTLASDAAAPLWVGVSVWTMAKPWIVEVRHRLLCECRCSGA
jgi:hypothetical protein